MLEVEENEDVHTVDTVPPPADGDAYTAATVVREAPSEVLDAIRKRREELKAASIPASPPVPNIAIPAMPITTPVATAAIPSIASESVIVTPMASTSPSSQAIAATRTAPPRSETSWLAALTSPENRSPMIAIVVGILLFIAAAYVLATSTPAH